MNLTALDSDDTPRLRREMRIHIGLAAGFSLTAVGFATAYVPVLLQGQLPVGTAILAAVTELGFVSLIWQEVRAAVRTKRELNLLPPRPEEQL